MACDQPIACSLSAAEMPERLAAMGALGRDALVRVEREPARAELHFAAKDGVRERVEALAAAERQCCPFLTLRVTAAGGEVVLAIDAPDDARPVLAGLVDAFAG